MVTKIEKEEKMERELEILTKLQADYVVLQCQNIKNVIENKRLEVENQKLKELLTQNGIENTVEVL